MKANHDDDDLTRKRFQKRASKPWQWNSASAQSEALVIESDHR
jgi:hypothetical protein